MYILCTCSYPRYTMNVCVCVCMFCMCVNICWDMCNEHDMFQSCVCLETLRRKTSMLLVCMFSMCGVFGMFDMAVTKHLYEFG